MIFRRKNKRKNVNLFGHSLQSIINYAYCYTAVIIQISITEETISDQEVADMNESVEESFVERQEADDDVKTKPRALGQQRAAVVRKLLTETKIPQPNNNFVRGTVASRSCRVESKKGDSLQYITDQYKVKVCYHWI